MAANQQRQNRRVITSFMLRFVREAEELPGDEAEIEEPPGGSKWRGVVKHIQSGAEQHFSTLAEAESFIKKYIDE